MPKLQRQWLAAGKVVILHTLHCIHDVNTRLEVCHAQCYVGSLTPFSGCSLTQVILVIHLTYSVWWLTSIFTLSFAISWQC